MRRGLRFFSKLRRHFKILCIFCFISAFFCLFGKLGTDRKWNRIIIEKESDGDRIVVYPEDREAATRKSRRPLFEQSENGSALYKDYLKNLEILKHFTTDRELIIAENLSNIVRAITVSIDQDANIVISGDNAKTDGENGEFGGRWANFGRSAREGFLGGGPGVTTEREGEKPGQMEELEILKNLRKSLTNKRGMKN